jgi:hypothetical protein
MRCGACDREYHVRKLEKRTSISNLPMSFGFRSMYWDRIDAGSQGLSGVSGEGYEIIATEGEQA